MWSFIFNLVAIGVQAAGIWTVFTNWVIARHVYRLAIKLSEFLNCLEEKFGFNYYSEPTRREVELHQRAVREYREHFAYMDSPQRLIDDARVRVSTLYRTLAHIEAPPAEVLNGVIIAHRGSMRLDRLMQTGAGYRLKPNLPRVGTCAPTLRPQSGTMDVPGPTNFWSYLLVTIGGILGTIAGYFVRGCTFTQDCSDSNVEVHYHSDEERPAWPSDEEHMSEIGMSTLHPQSGGVSFFSLLQDSLELRGVNLRSVSHYAAFIVGIMDASSFRGLLSTTWLFLETSSGRSVADTAMQSIFGLDLTEMHAIIGGGVEPQFGTAMVNTLKLAKVSWDAATHSELFGKIAKLVSVGVSLGLVTEGMNVSFRGIEIFSAHAKNLQMGATDMISAVLDTVAYFMEKGYQCVLTGSFTPLFESNEFMALYTRIREGSQYVSAGNLEMCAGITEDEFSTMLTTFMEKCKTGVNTSRGPERTFYQKLLVEVTGIRAAFLQKMLSVGLREAPFTYMLTGGSGVGKSVLNNPLSTMIAKTMGVPCADRNKAYLDENDAYDTAVKGHTTVLIQDDYGNTKAEFLKEKRPTDRIIRTNNNVTSAALKAAVEEKGLVAIRPKVYALTSNIDHLHARVFSVFPISVARRIHWRVEMVLDARYVLDSGCMNSDLVQEDFPEEPFPDIWTFTTYKVQAAPGEYEASDFRWIADDSMRIDAFLDFICAEAMAHMRRQKRLVRLNKDVDLRVTCRTCREIECTCDRCPCGFVSCEPCNHNWVRPQFGMTLGNWTFLELDLVLDFWGRAPFRYLRITALENALVEVQNTNQLRYYSGLCTLVCFYTLVVLMCVKVMGWYTIIPLWGLCLWIFFTVLVAFRDARLQIVFNSGMVDAYAEQLKARAVSYGMRTFALGAAILMARKLWKDYYPGVSPQGQLWPKSIEEVEERDSQTSPWKAVERVELPVSDKSRCLDQTSLANKAKKNLVFVTVPIAGTDKVKFSNAFFVRTGEVLLPKHFADAFGDIQRMTFLRGSRDALGTKFESVVDLGKYEVVEGQDVVRISVPNCPDFSDLSAYFPLGRVTNAAMLELERKVDGEVVTRTYTSDFKDNRHNGQGLRFYGSEHVLQELPLNGQCMSVSISSHKAPCIAGFHIAGGHDFMQRPLGVTAYVTQESVATPLKSLVVQVGVGDFPREDYGKELIVLDEPHYKSPVRFIDSDRVQCDVLGLAFGRARPRSRVQQSPISEAVFAVTGVPNTWGPPKMKGPTGHQAWYPWQANLAKTKPMLSVDPNALEWAINDYASGCIDAMKKVFSPRDFRELTRWEMVNGIDSLKFVDAIPKSTAMGYPLAIPKREMFTVTNDQGQGEFDPLVWESYDTLVDAFQKGERAYPIFKTTLKDEPTALTKEKVRGFQAAPLAFSLLVRGQLLTLLRAFRMFPLVSECAVGVNAEGPEWDELVRYAIRFGTHRMFAGDYKSFDLTRNPQLTRAVFVVYKMILKAFGRTDFTMIDGICAELCSPVVAYNGTMLMMHGLWPSGIPITVDGHNVVNALLMRVHYYLRCRELGVEVQPFREVASMVFYGDDMIGSINPTCNVFDMRTYRDFCANHELGFTMPDKTSEMVDFMIFDEVDFLKRKSRVNELGLYVSLLSDESIYKSLHCNLLSEAESPLSVSIACIDQALRAKFFYGEAVYEQFREDMKLVCEKCGISHLVPGLILTYKDRFTIWMERYELA